MVLVWMAVIFSFSSQTAIQSNQTSGGIIRKLAEIFISDFHILPDIEQDRIISDLQSIVRTAGHTTEYMVLGMLCAFALCQYRLSFKKRISISVCICLLYAISDEVHQIFVAGRTFQLSDIGFDLLGSLTGSLIISGIAVFIDNRRKKTARKNQHPD